MFNGRYSIFLLKMETCGIIGSRTVCLFCYKSNRNNFSDDYQAKVEVGEGFSEISNLNEVVYRFVTYLERISSNSGGISEDNDSLKDELFNLNWSKEWLGCCKFCFALVESFCAGYDKLKCLELEINWKLERLLGVMKLAGRIPTRLRKLREILHCRGSGTLDDAEMLTDLKSYREKIIKNCGRPLKQSMPRVQLKLVNFQADFGQHIAGSPEEHFECDGVDGFSDFPLENDDDAISHDGTIEESTSTIGMEAHPDRPEVVRNVKRRKPTLKKRVKSKAIPKRPICKFCGKLFPSQYSLSRHVRTDHLDKGNVGTVKTFPCPECHKTFINDANLREHLDNVHAQSRDHQCSECGKAFKTKKVLRAHELLHQGPSAKRFQCTDCGKTFFSKTHLKRHMVIHEKGAPVICQFCGKSFPHKTSLKSHFWQMHKDLRESGIGIKDVLPDDPGEYNEELLAEQLKMEIETNNLDETEIKVEIEEEEILECNKCNKIFATKKKLRGHIEFVHTTYNCSECGQKFKTRHFRDMHLLTHKDSPISSKCQCTICGRKFMKQSVLKEHMNSVHKKGTKVKCQKCDKTFFTQLRMRQHMRTVHTSPSHQCSVCKSVFKTETNLRKHQNIHADPQTWKYKCEICGKPFYEKPHLLIHLRTHNAPVNRKPEKTEPVDEEDLCCQFCGALFPSKRDLGIHLRKDHIDKGDIAEEKLFRCQICQKLFPSEIRLKDHKSRVHTTERKHQCSECGKAYKTNGDLQTHLMTHQGESAKKVQCLECGRMFYKTSMLNQHLIRAHGKEAEPSECELCGKSFPHSISLKQHLRRLHKIRKSKPGEASDSSAN